MTRHNLLRRLAVAAWSFAVGAKALTWPSTASAYIPCSCQNFAPEGYLCGSGTLYLAGYYRDCRYPAELCSGLILIPIGCC